MRLNEDNIYEEEFDENAGHIFQLWLQNGHQNSGPPPMNVRLDYVKREMNKMSDKLGKIYWTVTERSFSDKEKVDSILKIFLGDQQ